MIPSIAIVAYTYEADYHCVACTQRRNARSGFGRARFSISGNDYHGVPFAAEDREGNTIHPVFSTDEIPAGICCGDCHQPIL